jgi:hypothetical protein
MIELTTWLCVVALGPGAVAIFVWFLLDLRRILRRQKDQP